MGNMHKLREIMRKDGSIENRLRNLLDLSINDNLKFPVKLKWLGFPENEIKSQEELQGRIEELKEWLNVEVK